MRQLFLSIVIIATLAATLAAQSTEFTYQGQLQNAGTPGNGSFDFEFTLFDATGGGSQLGTTLTRSGVAVAGGIFNVNLDFGSVFPGAPRFLEIRVRAAGGGAFTTLSPRQSVNSSPYSVKSLNSENAANAINATTASNATNATTAATAGTFTGNLAGDVTGTQVSTTVARLRGTNVAATAPTNNQVLKFNSANSQWEPATDETGSGGGGGTITGVTAGTGLAGGGTAGTVAVAIANGGVGTPQIADGSVTDPKIVGVSGAKVTGAVANATNATTATNATQLGGVAANQYVQTNDPRLTDARAPTSGSSNYIQNIIGPPSQNPANFNISGTGAANVLSAATQYNLGGIRVLSAPGSENLFVGIGAGAVNTSGLANSFFGRDAGLSNTGGIQNSFFGSNAGQANINGVSNSFFGTSAGTLSTATGNSFFGALSGIVTTTGGNNSFFGRNSGIGNTTGNENSFFGAFSGASNTTASNNSFFGYASGSSNTTGTRNAFFGSDAGQNNTTGGDNAFFGRSAGFANTNGQRNSFFGHAAGQSTTTGDDNSFFGDRAGDSNIQGANNSFFGRDSGDSNTTGSFNVFVGSNSGSSNSTGASNSFLGTSAGLASTGNNNTFIGRSAGNTNTSGDNNTTLGHNSDVSTGSLSFATAIGAGAEATESNSVWLGRAADIVYVPGFLRLSQLGGAGTTALCRNNANTIGSCSASALRFKTNIGRLGLGLDLVKKLRPVTFDWKDGGIHDLGFIAEDVAAVEPLLAHYDKDGQIEGVKYDRIGVVLVNAVKEQQKQIEAQKIEIEVLTKRLAIVDELRKLLCSQNTTASVCKEEK